MKTLWTTKIPSTNLLSSPSARRIWWNPPPMMENVTNVLTSFFSSLSCLFYNLNCRRKYVWEWQSRLTTWWTPIHTWLTAPKRLDTPCGLFPFFRVCQLTSTTEQVHRQLVKWQKTIKVVHTVHSFVSPSSSSLLGDHVWRLPLSLNCQTSLFVYYW